MRRCVHISLFVILAITARAQYLDSLHQVFTGRSMIDARLESRYSFIRNELTTVTGVRLGIAYKRKLRIGGGVSWLSSLESTNMDEVSSTGETRTVTKYIKFAYILYYIDFVFYRTKRWQFSVPIQLGTGMAWAQKEEYYHTHITDKKHFLLFYEPGVTFQYKIFRYFGVGLDYGFRFVFRSQKTIGEQLNSPTIGPKILLWPDQLYYELFPKHKLTQRFGPAEW